MLFHDRRTGQIVEQSDPIQAVTGRRMGQLSTDYLHVATLGEANQLPKSAQRTYNKTTHIKGWLNTKTRIYKSG